MGLQILTYITLFLSVNLAKANEASILYLESVYNKVKVDASVSSIESKIQKVRTQQTFRDNFLPSFTSQLFAKKYDEESKTNTSEYNADQPWKYGIEFDLSYNLLNNFSAPYRYKSSLLEKEKSELTYINNNKTYVSKLAQAYVTYSLFVGQKKLLEEIEVIYKRILDITNKKYRSGIVSKTERDRSQLQVLQTQDEILTLKEKITNQLNEIVRLLGTPLEQKLDAIKDPEKVQSYNNWEKYLENKSINEAFDSLLNITTKNNTEIRFAEMEVKQKRKDYKAALTDLLPEVTFNINYQIYQYNQASFWQDDHTKDTTSLLSLQIPLFDGLNKYDSVKIESLNRQRAEYLRKISLSTNAKELKNHLQKAYQLKQQITLSKEKIILLDGIFDISFKKYTRGTLSLRNLLEDQNLLQRERIRINNDKHIFLTTIIKIKEIIDDGNDYVLSKLLYHNKDFL